jgi:hypothetical protein
MTFNGKPEPVHRLPAMEELLPPPLAGDSVSRCGIWHDAVSGKGGQAGP